MRAADNRASLFAIAHEDIAIPVLVNAVKAKLRATQNSNDKRTSSFLRVAVDYATYNATRRAVDAVADLCSVSQADCPWMVTKVLDAGTGQQHPYATAYDVVERYPNLRKLVLPWVEEVTTEAQLMATRFAQELLRREKAGHGIGENDAILSGLSPATRDVVNKAVVRERALEDHRRGKE